jgi:cell division protein ZapE
MTSTAPQGAPKTPIECYEADLLKPNFKEDAAQRLAVENLQRLYDELLALKPEETGFLDKLFGKENPLPMVKGLYFWGGVGRGKTYLVDTFYHCLPFAPNAEKKRIHFHVFMQQVHASLKQFRDKKDPLKFVADDMVSAPNKQRLRVLCFDEFVVTDVADAVILGKLMAELFGRNVTLVATSNAEPIELYKHGLQRDLFLPAIDLLYENTDVLNIDGGVDYRLAFLEKADIYFSPIDTKASEGLKHNFKQLAPESGKPDHVIEVLGRELQTKRWADGVVWFSFAELCETPRSQNDYIDLAKRFHTILLEGVPVFDEYKEDSARRLINLIDVFYEHNVKLILSAAEKVENLYIGKKPQITFEFDRTRSRLTEMQSVEYLAKPHIC